MAEATEASGSAAYPVGPESQPTAVERLAEAVLAGRMFLHTEWWEDRDGVQHARTDVEVRDE